VQVLGDGSLYMETVGFHLVGNLTCYDRTKPSIHQVHKLTVQRKVTCHHLLASQNEAKTWISVQMYIVTLII